MAKTRLSNAKYVERGYGQVEPNHLSAQRTGQIYAQMPLAADIEFVEQGQFAKYDPVNMAVNFTGPGEWLLIYNEVKLYRDYESECDFALKQEDYVARTYSPIDGRDYTTAHSRDYKGTVTGADPYEPDSTDDPFNITTFHGPQLMPEGSKAMPRLFKTNIGDIFTTNTVNEEDLAESDVLVVGDDGYLTKTAGSNAGTMQWQVVKKYTMPDGQAGVKIMRIA